MLHPAVEALSAGSLPGWFLIARECGPRACGTRSVLADQRDRIPTVTRIDGSARLHTVRRADHPRYWNLLDRFEPLSVYLLNTAFQHSGTCCLHAGAGARGVSQ
ncbi:MAG: hypothetical protein GDA65_06030 [Nitrospira sp. CR1.1]|nr:hypothetical protein [Nitrospira sp. CR1.1]